MNDLPAVVNTRPEPQASRFAAELQKAHGPDLQVIAAPLMEAAFLTPALPPGPFDALVLTSETGAEAAARLGVGGLSRLAFCVGDRTAEAARSHGFEAVSAGGDARDLARLLQNQPEQSHFLYLHGADRAADLGAALAPSGLKVTSLVTYRQVALPMKDALRARIAAGERMVLPLFSPRSARLFCAAIAGLPGAGLLPVVISENARLALSEPLASRAIVSEAPDGPAMLAAIGRCFGRPPA